MVVWFLENRHRIPMTTISHDLLLHLHRVKLGQ